MPGQDGPTQTHPGAPNPGQPGMREQQPQGFTPQHGAFGATGASGGQNQGGLGTPGRLGMPPSVVISPSAPVSVDDQPRSAGGN